MSWISVNRLPFGSSNPTRNLIAGPSRHPSGKKAEMRKTTVAFTVLLAMLPALPWLSYAGQGHNGGSRVFIGGRFWFGPPLDAGRRGDSTAGRASTLDAQPLAKQAVCIA
jgi:hypothetical protein